MPVATIWTRVPYPESSLGYGVDPYGISSYGGTTGIQLMTVWTEVTQTT